MVILECGWQCIHVLNKKAVIEGKSTHYNLLLKKMFFQECSKYWYLPVFFFYLFCKIGIGPCNIDPL